jgi:hypothetical protein
MDLKLSHCVLPVDDHEKALQFYRDVLGLEVRNDVSFEGMRWVTVGPAAQPEVEIVLEPPGANPNASPADRQVITELPTWSRNRPTSRTASATAASATRRATCCASASPGSPARTRSGHGVRAGAPLKSLGPDPEVISLGVLSACGR